MSQRESGYERKELDLYETPAWVTDALRGHLPRTAEVIWEPAAGSGKMVGAMRAWGADVLASDISQGKDFFDFTTATASDAIITNPPYTDARRFIEHALETTRSNSSMVAMLLRTDFDHAKTRQHLFSGCKQFAKKLVLTKRIKWFEDSKGQPSFNHAWFVWDWKHSGPPTLAYGP